MVQSDEVLAFWLDEVGPQGWYKQDAELDDRIRKRFRSVWDRAGDGGLGLWLTYPSGVLAFLIVTDQFPRNMFRGEPEAFALDHLAQAAAKQAIQRGTRSGSACSLGKQRCAHVHVASRAVERGPGGFGV